MADLTTLEEKLAEVVRPIAELRDDRRALQTLAS
jgi:hypothetical protein